MVAHVNDLVGHGPHEVLVVADEHEGAREADERILEHADRVDVEVVRGLVQAQQRVRCHKHAGEGEAGLLAAREHADPLVDVIAMEEEGAKEPSLLR